MNSDRFKELPLPILYELMITGVRELLTALDKKEPDSIEINLTKKRCELLHEAIVFVKAADNPRVSL
jgi:hypothetical protein